MYKRQFQYSAVRNKNQPLCLIMGSEEDGIQPAILKRATNLLTIPMAGKTTSLNVSVATGIALATLSQ